MQHLHKNKVISSAICTDKGDTLLINQILEHKVMEVRIYVDEKEFLKNTNST